MTLSNRLFALLLTGILISSTGCARHLVNNPTESYDSMGTLEEHVTTRSVLFTVLTLGIVQHRPYKYSAKMLNRKLDWTARHKFGADAVNNVQYWPDKESDAKIDVLYARGEMIRYKKFGHSPSAAA